MESPARAALGQAFKAYEAKNYGEAVRLYREAAEQGNASAQAGLDQLTRLGLGVPKDEATAVRWYRQAAERGHALAQPQLGLAYQLGEGVKEDWAAAHTWCRKSATQQHAIALGRCWIDSGNSRHRHPPAGGAGLPAALPTPAYERGETRKAPFIPVRAGRCSSPGCPRRLGGAKLQYDGRHHVAMS